MKTPITYWGGKQMLAKKIVANIPEHTTYVEPFLGGGAVFWAKQPSTVEVINDLNGEVVNFFKQVKSNYAALSAKISETPYSRKVYDESIAIYKQPHLHPPVDRAWAFFVATNQGWCGKIGSGYWCASIRDNRKVKQFAKDRMSFTEDYAKRLDLVSIECQDAIRIISRTDRPDTFFYIDPPYFNANMGHYGGYTDADFVALLDTCAGLQGKFLLSSYPSAVLAKYSQENGWQSREILEVCRASLARKKKTEVLTANYPILL